MNALDKEKIMELLASKECTKIFNNISFNFDKTNNILLIRPSCDVNANKELDIEEIKNIYNRMGVDKND